MDGQILPHQLMGSLILKMDGQIQPYQLMGSLILKMDGQILPYQLMGILILKMDGQILPYQLMGSLILIPLPKIICFIGHLVIYEYLNKTKLQINRKPDTSKAPYRIFFVYSFITLFFLFELALL